jgi:phosphatidylglycerophosphate synthase
MIQGQEPRYFMDGETDVWVVAGYAVCMLGGAWFIDSFRARMVAGQKRIRERAASSYRATVFIRLAIIESATLLLTVIALLTYNFEPLALVVLMLGAFYYFRPTVGEFAERYQ